MQEADLPPYDPAMTKESRQALVELLLLAIYQDDHLSLLEDAALEKALQTLGWEPGRDNELSLTSAFAAARDASEPTERPSRTHILEALTALIESISSSSSAGQNTGPPAPTPSNSRSSILMISEDSLLTMVAVSRSQRIGTVTRPE